MTVSTSVASLSAGQKLLTKNYLQCISVCVYGETLHINNGGRNYDDSDSLIRVLKWLTPLRRTGISGAVPNIWSFEPDLDCFRMSSDGKPISPLQARASRRCQAPRHLEDYVLDFHHRPALSSNPIQMGSEEQRGAAAAVYTSQADAASSQGVRRSTPSPNQADY